MSKSMKALVLAGVLSLAAVSAAQAGGKVTGGDFHASAAPTCEATGSVQKKAEDRLFGDRCRVIAGDTGPGGLNDDNGRSQTADDGPVNAGDHNGRSSAELNTWHPMLAGGGVRGGDISF